MERSASAIWRGSLKEGSGQLSTQSKTLSLTPYNVPMRFENEVGTNPEELLAAAHASCFTLALSSELGKIHLTPQRLEVTTTITLAKVSEGYAITKSHIALIAEIPGCTPEQFNNAFTAAKVGCPVSKLFNAEITISAELKT